MALSDLVSLLEPLHQDKEDGFYASAVSGVSLLRCQEAHGRNPIIYEPSLIFIAQGKKVGYLGDRVIEYNPGHYLVQTLPLPFECETYASQDKPLLGIAVSIDLTVLAELVHTSLPEYGIPSDHNSSPKPMDSVAMTEGMQEAVSRLVRALHDPLDAHVMGQARVREVVFEALKGQQGPALKALILHQGNYSRVIRVLSELQQKIDEGITVEALAVRANMSVSNFHKHFKEVTRCSPLQYLKRLRLIKARLLLSHDDLNVGQTARAVGYKSINQFSRDYKSYFGTSPKQDVRLE
ncbi:AraC family transcriptional regulator [Neptunomonas antarctica]|uniref:Transcriptional regulator, AraC family n=1 Tax=Neptunomonas antarctica TaxID=619304 RepID=A0A1N7MVI0_9GAMM|nr:AraC family transcriptional regulator N-terminal domain-containing protein [Neptunomonas antarctica]SIS90133.1 transcriptional regulator, AraC family [Neptunomonas antarctica]